MDEPADVQQAIAKYTAILTAMADMPSQSGVAESPRRWNRLANELQRQHLILRESPVGQRAISSLMDEPRPVVRAWASSHALAWDEARARSILETLRDDPGAGVVSIAAKYTLREFERGRLDPAWEPPTQP